MFADKNYAGCIDKITAYKTQTQDPDRIRESDYLLAASAFHLGRKEAGMLLKSYLELYPETFHRNEIGFMIGSVFFREKDYPAAGYWLEQCNIDLLPEPEQADLAYRRGIVCLHTGNDGEAAQLFALLNRLSGKYRSAAEYYLAYLDYRKQDYDRALTRFNALKNSPEFNPDVRYYITQIYFAKEKYNQAVQDGLRLLDEYPGHASAAETERIVGASYFYMEDYAKAARYLGAFVEKETAVHEKDYYMLGLSCYHLNEYEKATAFLSKSNPGNTPLGQSAYLYLGQSYLQSGDKTNALRAFESASRLEFDASAREAALYNYAMLLHQNSVSGFGESVTVLENFANTYPQSIYAGKVNDALVEVYLTTKNYDVALSSIAKIKNPGRKISEAKQKIYYHLGTVEFANGEYDRAIDFFTKAVASGDYAADEKAQAIYWRGESYYRKGAFARAAGDYQAFLDTKNNTGDLRFLSNYNLGYCAIQQKQYSKAETFFQTFIENKGKSGNDRLSDAYSRLGDCYFNSRRFRDAEEAYSQAINRMPQASDYALFQKGYMMGLQKNYTGKIAQMDELIRRFPQSPYLTDAFYEKGRTFVLLNNPAEAIKTYQLLLNNYPNANQARRAGLQIGLLYYNSNQPQQAATAYKQVIARYPGSDEAKVALQDLKSVYFDMNNIAAYAEYVHSLGGAAKFEVSEQDSLTFLAAERLFLKKDVKQAQTALGNYLQSFPHGAFTTNAHHYLATTYYDQKNYAMAKTEYAKVLEAGDTRFSEEAVGRTAELQYNDREYAAALQSYRQLHRIAGSKTNRETGALGMIRSAAQLKDYDAILDAANSLLADKALNPEIAVEAEYHRTKACLSLNQKAKAEAGLEKLARDTRTAYGAEARYLLAQYYFDENNATEAKIVIQDYIQQGTPYPYWLAKSFILLSDIYAAENDRLQARQYLESLQANYKNTNDGIHAIIRERLEKLN